MPMFRVKVNYLNKNISFKNLHPHCLCGILEIDKLFQVNTINFASYLTTFLATETPYLVAGS